MDLLDALVEEGGRVPATQALAVIYCTLAFCCDSRQVPRRMSRALLEFRNAGEAGDGESDAEDGGVADLRRRVVDL